MNKRYKYKFNYLIQFLMTIIIIIALIGILISFFKLIGFKEMKSFSIFIDVFNILVSIGIIVILIFVYNSIYIIKDDTLILRLSIMSIKIQIKDIQLLRQDQETKNLCLYYVTDKDKGIFNLMMITIENNLKDSFIKDLKEKNKNIVFEIVNKNSDNENLQ